MLQILRFAAAATAAAAVLATPSGAHVPVPYPVAGQAGLILIADHEFVIT